MMEYSVHVLENKNHYLFFSAAIRLVNTKRRKKKYIHIHFNRKEKKQLQLSLS